jgi:hypothetical protein
LPIRRLAFSLVFTVAVTTTAVAQQPPAPAPEVPPPATVPAVPLPAADRGDFRVVYEKATSPDNRELQEIFRGTRLLEETAKALNEKLALPADVMLTLRECGVADVTWEADKHRISICYELVGAFAELFLSSGKAPDAEQAGAAVAAATLFALLHETGHALIDLYQLPAAGREEAADQIATLILLGSGKEGGTTAVEDASVLLTQERDAGMRARLARIPFWSGHGFDEARLSNILCWVYGRDPQAFQELAGDGTLPATRAAGCAAEAERVAKIWAEPLAPYLLRWTLAAPASPAAVSAPSEPPSLPPPTSPPPPTP